jgi:ribosomal protein S27E
MVDFVRIKCPSCASKLEIYPDMTTFACGDCGKHVSVKRRGGTVSLALEESSRSVASSTGRTAAELALVRLEKELMTTTEWVESLEESSRRFNAHDLMSDTDAAATQARERAMRTGANQHQSLIPVVGGSATVILVLIGLAMASSKHGIDVFFALISYGVAGIIVFFVIMIPTAIIDSHMDDRRSKLLANLERKLARHEAAAAHQERLRYLPDARAAVVRINEEIACNRRIVSS